MPAISLFLDGDRCWPDLREKMRRGEVIDVMGNGQKPIGLAVLPGGMASGKASVTIRVDLPDGRVLLTETSLALLLTSLRAIEARYGDLERGISQ